MKKKKDSIKSLREVRLSVRLSAEDMARLKSLQAKLEPMPGTLSLGKTLSYAIRFCDEKIKAGERS